MFGGPRQDLAPFGYVLRGRFTMLQRLWAKVGKRVRLCPERGPRSHDRQDQRTGPFTWTRQAEEFPECQQYDNARALAEKPVARWRQESRCHDDRGSNNPASVKRQERPDFPRRDDLAGGSVYHSGRKNKCRAAYYSDRGGVCDARESVDFRSRHQEKHARNY